MGFWCVTLRVCSQVDGCLLSEDKTLLTVMKVQSVAPQVTVSSSVYRYFSVSLCLRAAQMGSVTSQDIRRTNVRFINVY
jgi:hypothetical protein